MTKNDPDLFPQLHIVKIDVAGNRVFIDSRNLASYVRKEHKHVLRDLDTIRGVGPNLDIPPHWFNEVRSINDQNGQTYRYFELTEDGMVLLFMQWSTERLLPYKIEYLKAVNAMKEELARMRAAPVDVASLMRPGGAPRSSTPKWLVRFGTLTGPERLDGDLGFCFRAPCPERLPGDLGFRFLVLGEVSVLERLDGDLTYGFLRQHPTINHLGIVRPAIS
jgi:Rha family phage regulatory protein